LTIDRVPEYEPFIDPPGAWFNGLIGDTISIRINIRNDGFWPDTYALTATHDDWETFLTDAASGQLISSTPLVQPGTVATVQVRVVVPDSPRGAADTLVITALSSQVPGLSAQTELIASSLGPATTIPWHEDFSTALFNPSLWTSAGQVAVIEDPATLREEQYSAMIIPTSYLTTEPLDLAGLPEAQAAFQTILLETCNADTDTLTVQYISDRGYWRDLLRLPGDESAYNHLDEHVFDLPVDALHRHFRLRWYTPTTWEDCPRWVLDNIYVGLPREHYFHGYPERTTIHRAAGYDALFHIIIENHGRQDDQYLLTIRENEWTASFPDGQSELYLTPTVPAGNSLTIPFHIAIPVDALQFAEDPFWIDIVSQGDGSVVDEILLKTRCLGEIGLMPWYDGFSDDILAVQHWPINIDGDVHNLGAAAPSPPYTMRLNAVDTVYSLGIDMLDVDDAMLDFQYRAGLNYLPLHPYDSLFIEIFDPAVGWTPISVHQGIGRWLGNFQRESIRLPATALTSEFQMRLASRTYKNSWLIDDIRITHPPQSSPVPEVVEFTLGHGESASATLAIGNSGPGELEYALQTVTSQYYPPAEATAFARISSPPERPLASNTLDDHETNFARANIFQETGEAGYIGIDSDHLLGPSFFWEDISGIGRTIALENTTYFDTLHLPFVFPYYDSAYTSVLLSRFGGLQFGTTKGMTAFYPFPIPYTYPPNNILAWCWDRHQSWGTVYAHGQDDRFIIQFNGFGHPTNPEATATAQVILYADGRISYRYLEFKDEFPVSECSVGMENHDGSDGLGVVFVLNNYQPDPNYLHDSLQIDFYPPPSWITIDEMSGIIPDDADQLITVTADAGQMPAGEYHVVLELSSNDPEHRGNKPLIDVVLNIISDGTCFCPLGDLNIDGKINSTDLTILLNYLLKGTGTIPTIEECPFNLADVNGDGGISLGDMVTLVNYIYRAGPSPPDPCEP